MSASAVVAEITLVSILAGEEAWERFLLPEGRPARLVAL